MQRVQRGASLNCINFVVPMNPCPCGYYPDIGRCSCTPQKIKRYQGHVSGPILDRIDLCAGVSRVTAEQLSRASKEESSKTIRERVVKARKIQEERYAGKTYRCNALLPQAELKDHCRLERKEEQLMEKAFQSMQMSVRCYYRILKVARTIADLDGCEKVEEIHIEEALECRMGGETYWGT